HGGGAARERPRGGDARGAAGRRARPRGLHRTEHHAACGRRHGRRGQGAVRRALRRWRTLSRGLLFNHEWTRIDTNETGRNQVRSASPNPHGYSHLTFNDVKKEIGIFILLV